VRPEAWSTVRKAKAAGLRVGILSNELELFYGRETIERLDILKLMDCLIDATHTQILKPDPRAYALGCEALGLPRSQIVFLDDQQRNVDGGRKAGLLAVRLDVTRPVEGYSEVERLLSL
jgi:putative hydrolase of the HAD superfamily